MSYVEEKKALVSEVYLQRTAEFNTQAGRVGAEASDLIILRSITSSAYTDILSRAGMLKRFDVDTATRTEYIDTMFDSLQENIEEARKLAHKHNKDPQWNQWR